MKKIARLLFVLTGVGIMAAGLIFGGPVTAGNHKAMQMIVTLFSILTGFIIAVITMSGDPGILYPGSWRVASAHRRQIKRVLFRYRLLFYAYLLTLFLAFGAAIVGQVDQERLVTHWIERVALSLGGAALFWSFGLPTTIIRAQLERIDKQVEQRESQDKGTASSTSGIDE